MNIQIDQSGKIERLNQDTVIAMSNSEQYSIKIPKKLKRDIYTNHRKKIKQINYKLFCIGIFHCIKDYIEKINLIAIDDEYRGKNYLIKSILLSYIRQMQKDFDSDMIRFDQIGRGSNAHHLAIETFRSVHKPNEILTEKQIWGLLK